MADPVIEAIAQEMDDLCSHMPARLVEDETLAKVAAWRDRLVALFRTWAAECGEAGTVTLSRHELDQLLAAATVYVEAFAPDEMMTLPGKLALQEVEAVLEKYGKRY